MIGRDMRTYIYIRPEDGKCVHQQACGAIFGQEYEHDDPNWQPPKDWPYEVRDLRKPAGYDYTFSLSRHKTKEELAGRNPEIGEGKK